MASINPYLNFNGETQAAFDFYKKVFGTEFNTAMRFKDMPPEYQGGPTDAEKIMHVSLPIGDGTVLMGSDVPEAMGKVTMGNNFSISITAASQQEADKLFAGLSEGGKVTMPLSKAFWGSYFGMLEDKFGISWMVSYGQQN